MILFLYGPVHFFRYDAWSFEQTARLADEAFLCWSVEFPLGSAHLVSALSLETEIATDSHLQNHMSHQRKESSVRIRMLLASGVATVLALASCQSRSANFTPRDEAAIRAMIAARVTNIRAGDWVKWSTQHVEDVIVQPPNGPAVKGRAATLAWGQAFPPIDSLALSDIHVSGEGNLAYATTAYTLKLKDLPLDRGKELLVFRRPPGGQWQVVAFSLSSDLPAPAPSSSRSPAR